MMSFEDIDRRRREAGLTRQEVYQRAQVDGETWRRLADGRSLGRVTTLKKLSAAIDELAPREGEANGTAV